MDNINKDAGNARERPRPPDARGRHLQSESEPRSKSAGSAPVRDPATGELAKPEGLTGMLANPWVRQYVTADRRPEDDEQEGDVPNRAKNVDAGPPPSREGGPAGERLREFEQSRKPQRPTSSPDEARGAPTEETDRK